MMRQSPQSESTISQPTTLVLYVRALSPEGHQDRQESILRRLAQLESDGVVSETTVHVWGQHVTPELARKTEAGRDICEQIDRFREWATEHDVSLEPFFRAAPVRSELADEEYTRVQLPTVALAEYAAGALRFVTPCVDGEKNHTVTDRLDTLGADKFTATRLDPLPRTAVDQGGECDG